MWNEEVINLVREVEKHINGKRTSEALKAFSALCTILHINNVSPSYNFVHVPVQKSDTYPFGVPPSQPD